ncbi:MAG: hypothetical protein DMF65_02710 [Acidobacteria bacterium]|nr:MAG: hypothetical protein DMF65_02710 [Acidobacteriota bacterium]
MLYRVPTAESPARALRLKKSIYCALAAAVIALCASAPSRAQRQQGYERELEASGPVELRVKNRTGRVTVIADDETKKVSVRATSAAGLSVGEKDVRVSQGGASVTIDARARALARLRRDGGRRG